MKNFSTIAKTVCLIAFALGNPVSRAQVPEPPDVSDAIPQIQKTDLIDRDKIVIIGSNLTLTTNESAREVVVIGGDVILEGNVSRDVVVVGGKLDVHGKIGGGLVAVLTPTTIGPKASIHRETVVVGGKLDISPGAKIKHQKYQFSFTNFPGADTLSDWFRAGLLLGRPLPHQFAWAWMLAALILGFRLVVGTLFAKQVASVVGVLEQRPAGSFFTGVLSFVLFAPVCALLAISVIGILVIPFLLCSIVAAIMLGKIAVLERIGMQIGGGAGASKTRGPILALVIGSIIVTLIYMIPVIGFLALGVITVQALGASILAICAAFIKEAPPTPTSTSALPSGAHSSGAVPVYVGPPEMATASLAFATPEGSAPMPPPPLSSSAGAQTIYMERVGFWRRFWASVLDLILVGAATVHTFGPFFIILFAAYFVAMWTWKGTTIGGIVLGLKVVRTDGSPVTFPVALVRSLSSMFSAVVFFLGFFWAAWDRDHQSWHDKIAGTVVVRVPKGFSLI
ncbi:MAG: hypothetical protein JWM99_1766 [Verrucomicrobiales bacterium]|nr:hypothetical protein [Verrucomicrobiales bacterium]